MCKALGWVGVGVKPIRACLCLWSQRPSLLWCSPAVKCRHKPSILQTHHELFPPRLSSQQSGQRHLTRVKILTKNPDGSAHRGANGVAMPTDEDDQDGHFFYNHPERGAYSAA